MKTNKKAIDYRVDTKKQLAGGFGAYAAKQDAESLLRRSVLACLLWEDNFYEDGISNTETIKKLIPLVPAETVFNIAIEARMKQKLRHVPLLMAREMAKIDTHKGYVGKLLPQIIQRADELTEFLSLYWKDKKTPISKQIKIGLANAFIKFGAYELAKYNRNDTIKLKDVLFLCHAKPKDKEQEQLWKQLINGTLPIPDTWEVALSTGKDKKETWSRLIYEKKIGALAFIRNLRNMQQVGVERAIIQKGFETINTKWLLPINYFAAAKYAPELIREIETLMMKNLSQMDKLPGYTIFIVDVSGSMREVVSTKSEYTRLDVAAMMAMMASETCEHISIYVTAGSDATRMHDTKKITPYRGFALCNEITNTQYHSRGGGGIFTRQCLEHIKECESERPDRIIIFSDSQDCDLSDRRIPAPFGEKNYIIDVSSHSNGINYKGIWTAEISGWSEHFLHYIFEYEGINNGQNDSEEN